MWIKDEAIGEREREMALLVPKKEKEEINVGIAWFPGRVKSGPEKATSRFPGYLKNKDSNLSCC